MAKDRKEYKILIIEDCQGDLALVEDFLFEQVEYPKISLAKDFREAKEVLGDSNNKFDIILLDLSLPDKTGEPLIREIVELSQNMPIIVLTGYADLSFGVKSLSLGISDYLLKDDLTPLSLYKSIIYSAERKRSVAELQQSERRYSEVFNSSPVPMWVVDVTTLKFLEVNRATIEHYGYSREELLSMTIKDIRAAEDFDELKGALEETSLNPQKTAYRITKHKKKNGEFIKVEVQFAQFEYKGIVSNIVISNDITERSNYIKAIEEQNEKLKEISWIQSHIVRAPLSRIMGLVPLIKEANDCPEDKEKMLDYIIISANELDEIIRNITDKTIAANYKID